MHKQVYAQAMHTETLKPQDVAMNVPLFDALMRAQDCVSDESCARLIGCHRSTVSRLRDQTCNPTGAVMLRIAKVLGVTVEVLFTEVEKTR